MKRSHLFFSLALIFLVSSSIFAQSQIQMGKYNFDQTISNYCLANGGDQERTQLMTVYFPKPFKTTPQVMLSVTKYDGDKATNTRFDVKVTSVSKTTMQLEAKTWGGTKIYLIAGEWIAIGE